MLLHVMDVTHSYFEEQAEVVRQTLAELGATGKPTLLVFNKVDALEDRGLLEQLRSLHPDGVFISARRGIGLDELRARVLDLVEADYVEGDAVLPIADAKARAHVHRVAEVTGETVGHATDEWDTSGTPLPVVRLQYRASTKNAPELARMLARYGSLRWTGESTADASGDGAAPEANLPAESDPDGSADRA